MFAMFRKAMRIGCVGLVCALPMPAQADGLSDLFGQGNNQHLNRTPSDPFRWAWRVNNIVNSTDRGGGMLVRQQGSNRWNYFNANGGRPQESFVEIGRNPNAVILRSERTGWTLQLSPSACVVNGRVWAYGSWTN